MTTYGQFEWTISLVNDDGWSYVPDIDVCMRYEVKFGRREITASLPVDPPEGDEVEWSNVEVLCHHKARTASYVPVEQLPEAFKLAVWAALEADTRLEEAIADKAKLTCD